MKKSGSKEEGEYTSSSDDDSSENEEKAEKAEKAASPQKDDEAPAEEAEGPGATGPSLEAGGDVATATAV